MKIEIDSDAADALGCAWLKELRGNLRADIRSAASKIDDGPHQEQNLIDSHHVLAAIDAVLNYCGEVL